MANVQDAFGQQKACISSSRYSRLVIQETAEEVGMSHDSYHTILNEKLSIQIAPAMLIPLLSTVDQT
jgi:hypothetical protein